ncbi:beta strand repeat-containing protein [Paenibacillus luteus]|uniref:beta strand repeat-containing protein n=1 Tax=Paenibacillus luteus TaxID=2545753 RepID=UPI0011448BBC|nr:DUF11 domain-containing protein [Paenibacillus luteus]
MPFVNRFLLNANGGITFTGNTLGLSRSNTVGVPGTVDSIGAFITTDTTQTFGTYPAGTTGNFAVNSSSAVLVLPAGSSILYAELIWGGTYIDNGVDLSAFIDNDVQFTTPTGLVNVAPDPNTAQSVLLSNSAPFSPTFAYVRSAQVTSLIQAAGAGTYTTGGVVGTIVIPDPTSNHAGWTLAVVYQNPTFPLRNLSIRVGATVILSSSGPVSTVVNGFATPVMGPLNGRAFLSAQEGDANKTGDQALFGPDAGSLTVLSGPNNFANNFFASQINQDDGTLNMSGTFGNRNQVNGNPGTNIVGGRQGYDITAVDVSGTLFNNQTSAVLQLTTNGDGYLVNANGLQININTPLVSVVKSSSQIDAVVGDTVTYTVVATNLGVVDAIDAMFFDIVSAGAAFVAGSVTINGVADPDGNPALGVPIGNIPAGGMTTITFKTTVVSVPNPSNLVHQARVAYTYQPTPTSPIISDWIPSNIVTTPVYDPRLQLTKSASETVATVGDTVTFTLLVANTGNIAVTGSVVDSIPSETAFVSGSVTVNGVSQPTASPSAGINIATVAVGATTTVAFQVTVIGIPASGVITNEFNVPFAAMLPDGRVLQSTAMSNVIEIPVFAPVVLVNKLVNAIDAVIGDVLTYTINVTNNNAAPINTISVTDVIQSETTFVSGSVTVNGLAQPSANPAAGISIGSIAPGATVPVTFQVTVVSLPNPAVITDQATVNYIFGAVPEMVLSNTVTTPVFQPALTVVKRSDLRIAATGDTVNFSFTVQNTGNIAVVGALTDVLVPQEAFVAGSVLVNGVSLPAADPAIGIPLGSISPQQFVLVSFNIVIVSWPPDQLLNNQGTVAYTYQPPDGRILNGSTPSNIVTIQNVFSDINLVKLVYDPIGSIGDKITFVVTATNTGTETATSIIVRDTITPGTQFVANSVTVNGVQVAGVNPTTGIPVPDLAPGAVATITFEEEIITIPELTYILDTANVSFLSGTLPLTFYSNTINVQVAQPIITAFKVADRTFVTIGDIIHYTVSVTNSGTYNVETIFSDPIPAGTVFVENSVIAFGVPLPGTNPSSSIFIGTLEYNETNLITYQVRVVSVPPSGFITNQAKINFSYTLPNTRNFTGSTTTNTVNIPVLGPPVPTLTKSANTSEIEVGQTLAFTIVVQNPSTLSLSDVVLTDLLPAGLVLEAGSVTIDGVAFPAINPTAGIALGTLAAKASTTVKFRATAVSEPDSQIFVNQAGLAFRFAFPDGRVLSGSATSNPVTINVIDNEE